MKRRLCDCLERYEQRRLNWGISPPVLQPFILVESTPKPYPNLDDLVEVEGDDLGDFVQLLKVVLATTDEGRQGKRGEVTYSSLIRRRILDDFGAEIGRFDGAKVLLV